MKLKATISLPGPHFSPTQRLSLARLVNASNGSALHAAVYRDVLQPHLRVAEFGPAEFFTQLTDRMTRTESDTVGIDIVLSGVSVTARRAQQDFWDALGRLDEIYRNITVAHLCPDLEGQIFTRMALDAPIQYLDRHGSTSLLEIGPTKVRGLANIAELEEPEVIVAELEALLGDRQTVHNLLRLTYAANRTEGSDLHQERGR